MTVTMADVWMNLDPEQKKFICNVISHYGKKSYVHPGVLALMPVTEVVHTLHTAIEYEDELLRTYPQAYFSGSVGGAGQSFPNPPSHSHTFGPTTLSASPGGGGGGSGQLVSNPGHTHRPSNGLGLSAGDIKLVGTCLRQINSALVTLIEEQRKNDSIKWTGKQDESYVRKSNHG